MIRSILVVAVFLILLSMIVGCTVDDESIRMFVTNPSVVHYFSELVIFLRQQSYALDALVAEVSK